MCTGAMHVFLAIGLFGGGLVGHNASSGLVFEGNLTKGCNLAPGCVVQGSFIDKSLFLRSAYSKNATARSVGVLKHLSLF